MIFYEDKNLKEYYPEEYFKFLKKENTDLQANSVSEDTFNMTSYLNRI